MIRKLELLLIFEKFKKNKSGSTSLSNFFEKEMACNVEGENPQ